ncbi:MAG: hypothetical protein V3V96_17205, partial [Acidiferrobacterales bacterium]
PKPRMAWAGATAKQGLRSAWIRPANGKSTDRFPWSFKRSRKAKRRRQAREGKCMQAYFTVR